MVRCPWARPKSIRLRFAPRLRLTFKISLAYSAYGGDTSWATSVSGA